MVAVAVAAAAVAVMVTCIWIGGGDIVETTAEIAFTMV